MTTYLIGVDEAGYGPNLGPLVVAATVWEVDKPSSNESANGSVPNAIDLTTIDWYGLLADCIGRTHDNTKVAIADSKTLYSPATGLTLLEEGVLAALESCMVVPTTWNNLIRVLDADTDGDGKHLPWHDSWDVSLPLCACSDRIKHLTHALRQSASAANGEPCPPHIKLHRVAASLVHPAKFNRLTSESNSKATALSRISLTLLDRVTGQLAPSVNSETSVEAIAVCDKHGGRDHYAPLLMESFGDVLVRAEVESRAASRYRLRIGSTNADISFRRKGEAFLPTALASMTAKYVRELAMRAFNEYWSARVAGLRPTAGYPVDAKRFKRDIAVVQSQLGIEDHILWRTR